MLVQRPALRAQARRGWVSITYRTDLGCNAVLQWQEIVSASPSLLINNIGIPRVRSHQKCVEYSTAQRHNGCVARHQDPHFKKPNHRRRVIQTQLLAEYAYVLKPGGLLYTVTDVEELAAWMRNKLDAHPLFERVPEDELARDAVVPLLTTATEEGQKVARNGGQVLSRTPLVFFFLPGCFLKEGWFLDLGNDDTGIVR